MDWATDKIPGGVPSMSATEKNICKLGYMFCKKHLKNPAGLFS